MTVEDGIAERNEVSPYIRTEDGKGYMVNPEYDKAPFEYVIIFDPSSEAAKWVPTVINPYVTDP